MLTQDEARALALRAQGFGGSYAEPLEVLRTLGVVQLDSVSTVARSHELAVYSRFGPYDVQALYKRIYRDRQAFEYWGHSASWLPYETFSLFQHRMVKMRESGRGATTVNIGVRDEFADMYGHVIERITAEGPLSAVDFGGQRRGPGGWWNHKPAKQVLEDLFDQGELMCAKRSNRFNRVYDLAGRVLPADVNRSDPGEDAAVRELLLAGIRSCGVAGAPEAADYFRLQKWKAPWRAALAGLVADGRVVEVKVDGWRGIAYALPEALEGPRDVPLHRPVFLSPLDNLLWERRRVKRLFGFEHTFEIYVPEAKRKYGYLVLPLLAEGQLGGRADLKLDRAAGILLVKGLWLEGAAAEDPVWADNATAALQDLARHLGVQKVEVNCDRGGPAEQVGVVSAALASSYY